ncbi:hypothetical protein [Cupriavidus sp. CP313]
MKATIIRAILSSVILSAGALTAVQAQAQGPKDSPLDGDKYGYVFRQAKFDAFTEGAHGIKRPDPYTDGANIHSPRDPFTDGARASGASQIAGKDRTGVSAPPEHSANADTTVAV